MIDRELDGEVSVHVIVAPHTPKEHMMRCISWTGFVILLILHLSVGRTTAAPPSNPLRGSIISGEMSGSMLISPGTTFSEPGMISGELVNLEEVQQAGYLSDGTSVSVLRQAGYSAPVVSQSVLQQSDAANGEVEVLPEPSGANPASDTDGQPSVLSGGTIIQGDCGWCNGMKLGICADGCLIPCPEMHWEKFQFFAGVAGFTSPANRGGHGSFGFSEGFNWGTGFAARPKLSGQIGYRAIQSSFSGTDFTDIDRKQSFITAGIFRRADWGIQGGVVVDYMHDDWYYDLDVIQIRGEMSWKYPDGHEIGFWFARASDGSTSTSELGKSNPVGQVETWDLTHLYAFYYRTQHEAGGESRVFGGFTGDQDGLLGADMRLPINGRLALESNFTYLIPEESSMTTGHVEEGWNVGIGLVFFPGCNTPYTLDYNRPLFNVADNGTMLLSPR